MNSGIFHSKNYHGLIVIDPVGAANDSTLYGYTIPT